VVFPVEIRMQLNDIIGNMEAAKITQDQVLREIVSRLISWFGPKKILLFGSRARGSAHVDSDYDLLIVWRDENPPAARAAAIRRALMDLGKPLDIAVVTPQEYERFRNRRAHIVAIADREGKVLHAANLPNGLLARECRSPGQHSTGFG
jgi:predicted nucleotidyltransferase